MSAYRSRLQAAVFNLLFIDGYDDELFRENVGRFGPFTDGQIRKPSIGLAIDSITTYQFRPPPSVACQRTVNGWRRSCCRKKN